jgi:hypothetical protein
MARLHVPGNRARYAVQPRRELGSLEPATTSAHLEVERGLPWSLRAGDPDAQPVAEPQELRRHPEQEPDGQELPGRSQRADPREPLPRGLEISFQERRLAGVQFELGHDIVDGRINGSLLVRIEATRSPDLLEQTEIVPVQQLGVRGTCAIRPPRAFASFLVRRLTSRGPLTTGSAD